MMTVPVSITFSVLGAGAAGGLLGRAPVAGRGDLTVERLAPKMFASSTG